MIRKAREEDIAKVSDIWLDTNLKAHDFIPGQYWRDNFEAVKELLAQAELYVYEDEYGIQGFAGLNGDYIAGIFVWSGAQSRGIGSRLIRFLKSKKRTLRLNVYQKNVRAVKFYQRENFKIYGEGIDENTGETEYAMKWKKRDRRPVKDMARKTCKLGETVI